MFFVFEHQPFHIASSRSPPTLFAAFLFSQCLWRAEVCSEPNALSLRFADSASSERSSAAGFLPKAGGGPKVGGFAQSWRFWLKFQVVIFGCPLKGGGCCLSSGKLGLGLISAAFRRFAVFSPRMMSHCKSHSDGEKRSSRLRGALIFSG